MGIEQINKILRKFSDISMSLLISFSQFCMYITFGRPFACIFSSQGYIDAPVCCEMLPKISRAPLFGSSF
jgi:hypothetical protein